MFQQPQDFRDESDALYGLIKDLSEDELRAPTQFKGWTIRDVIGHLHIWNEAAHKSLTDEAAFNAFPQERRPPWGHRTHASGRAARCR